MYAGTTIRHSSGRIAGVHQKIDRAARRNLKHYLPKSIEFPEIKDILHFEGANGPDGIKRKGPGTEPWHFIDPNDPDDRQLLNDIDDHLYNLSKSLKNGDKVRGAFEAAWLSHAVVDGLTPAHHYPLDDKIEELWGKARDERKSIFEKNVIVSDSLKNTLKKNWEYWGTGGVFTTHSIFEMGSASALAPDRFRRILISRREISRLKNVGFERMYLDSIHKINRLHIYEKLAKKGWTSNLARTVRDVLIPEMVKMVVLAWYEAATNPAVSENEG